MEPTDADAGDLLRPAPRGPEPVDAEKVAVLRGAVQAGTLHTDAQRIAARLLDWERLLTRT